VKGKRCHHTGHRILRNHVENMAVKRDDAGRIRPVKPRRTSKHIDGGVATLMAQRGLSLMAGMTPAAHQMFFLGGK
jgi:phage terminase large subunit-like protein